ncbi:MAG: phosphatase PAP2 family protein [Nitrospiraceae bacterium]|nr:phosphatase PAP2 family protein [Nitrospiraceae bacterium]
MRFLKENKTLLLLVLVLPLFIFYLDGRIISAVREFHRKGSDLYVFLTSLDAFINFLSHGSTLMVIALVTLVTGRYRNRRLFETGKALVVSFAASGILAQALKHLIGRARPRITDTLLFIGPTFRRGYDSFPSGHTTVAFCFAYTLSQHFPRYRAVFYIFATVVGLERVENTAHFSSDVIAGALVGIISGQALCRYLLPALEKGVFAAHADKTVGA